MQTRTLGNTGLELPILSFGASSLGQEFRNVDINEALRSVHVALDLGMNFIDTSPYYGRGMSEVLLGVALRDVPRDSYILGTKLGRYDGAHFDFSAKRVVESVDISLHRMGVDHLDICLCHDIEFVDMSQIIEETLPALRKVQEQGKVRFVGVSGYPMKMFRYVLDNADLDCMLSYNHYTLQNTMLADLVPYLKERGVGIMNAAPFSARLLTHATRPERFPDGAITHWIGPGAVAWQLPTGARTWSLVIGAPQAGPRAAVLYSILASAKRHHVEPWAYLKDLLLRLHAEERKCS